MRLNLHEEESTYKAVSMYPGLIQFTLIPA